MVTGPGDKPIRKARRVPAAPVPKPAPVPSRPLVLAPKPHPVGVFKQPAPKQDRTFPATPRPQPVRARRGPSQADIAHAKQLAAEIEAKARKAPPLQVKTHPGGPLGIVGTSTAAARVAAFANPYGALVGTANLLTKGRVARDAIKAASNAPKDAAELITTTPTNLIKLGDTAIHHPKKLPGMLAQPYIDLAKNPEKALTEHPVSTALMVAPAVKVPGRLAGRALRIAGKQTLERVPASLPATALKEVRGASRDAVVNALQKSRDAKRTTVPLMTKKGVQKRVDEFYDTSTQKRAQIEAAAHRTAKQQNAGLPRAQRNAAIQANVEGARLGSRTTIDKMFAKEFGSTWQVDPNTGAILKPKGAAEGHLHPTREAAQRVADRLNAKPAMIPNGRRFKLADAKPVPLEFKVRPVGKSQFAVLPKIATERLYGGGGRFGAQGHVSVGSGKQVMAKVMRVSRRQLTQAVLPLSPKWLGGQVGEAGLRAMVSGSGPLDVLRVSKVVKELNKHQPHLGDQMLMRISGGQFGLTGTAREFAVGKRTLADEFQNTSLEGPANAASAIGRVAPARAAKAGWRTYSTVVFNEINGPFEQTARKAMAGQTIKDRGGPLMQRSMLGLSDKAIAEAAQGLHASESQVALGRAVDRMYGKYQKFSPEKRSLLLHWTPFLPWYINVVTFLTKVLPVDHPLHAALMADANVVLEDWRKKQHVSLFDPAHKPTWMLGGYPTSKGMVPVSRFTPFGIASDPAQAVADLTLPQFSGPWKNLGGVDWKWAQLKHPGYNGKPFTLSEKMVRALVSGAESQVPGVTQAGRLSGVTPRLVDHKAPGKIDSPGKAALKLINPLTPVPNTDKTPPAGAAGVKTAVVKIKPVKVRAVRIKPVKVR